MNNSTLTLIRPLCLVMMTAVLGLNVAAQCSQTSTIAPSSASNDDGTGAWGFTSPSAALFPDNSFATATATLALLGGHTDYLKVQGFGLSIPQAASICGIQMTMNKSASGINVLASVSDYRIRLMKEGTLVGSNKAKSGSWGSSESTFTYGAAGDLWGTSWSAAELNSGDFGVAVSAQINGVLSLLPSANINDVSLKVFYQVSTLPIRLVSFNGQLTATNEVKLNWVTSGEEGNVNFIVQRSLDGASWNDVETIAADETGIKTDYTFNYKQNVKGKIYFRLALRSSTGAVNYSDVITVLDKRKASLNVFPNPATESATIISDTKINAIKIFNAMGVNQPAQVVKISDNSSRVNISQLPTGIYYVQADGEMIKLMKK